MQFAKKLKQGIETSTAKRLHAVLEYLIAIILLIGCDSIWVTISSMRGQIYALSRILLGVAVLGCIFLSGAVFSKDRIRTCAIGIGALAIYAAIFLQIQRDTRISFAQYIVGVCILLVYALMCFDGGVPSLLIRYSRIVAIVAGFSVVMWLLCSVLKIIPPTGVVLGSWSGIVDTDMSVDSYFGVYFTTQGMRNTSIFAEAPVAALQYSLALLIQVFFAPKANMKIVAVLFVAIATTQSTMGYLIAVVALAYYVLSRMAKKGWFSQKSAWALLISALAMGTIAVMLVMQWKVNTTSGLIRTDDLIAGWKSFKMNPIFGNGYEHLEAIRAHMSEWRYSNMGYSSGLMWVLSDGGLYFAVAYLYPIIRAVVYGIMHRQIKIILFAVALFLLVLINVFHYSFLMTLLLLFLAMVGRERAPIKDAECGKEQS